MFLVDNYHPVVKLMFNSDLTLNANAFTGVSAAKIASLVSTGPGYTSLRSVASLSNTTPLELDVQHQVVKRGKAKYIRSTVGLKRRLIAPTTANPEGVTSYETSARIIMERPETTGVVTTAEVVTQLGELLSVFGVSLSSGGNPTTAMEKFLNRET